MATWRTALWSVLYLLAFACLSASPAKAQAHLDTSRAYAPTEEVGDNQGPEIVIRSLKSVGLGPGYPYCAAFQSYGLETTPATKPQTRTALATDFLDSRDHLVVDARDVRLGRKTVPPGSIVIWRKGNGVHGHAGITDSTWSGPCGYTVEANTGPPDNTGKVVREGDGIYRKRRCIDPSAYMRIEGFVLVEYPLEDKSVRKLELAKREDLAKWSFPELGL